MSDIVSEPYEKILDKSKQRFTIFPLEYPELFNLYKKQQASMWKAEEIDFSKDYDDFTMLTENEQHFIKRVLAFFASSDGIVNSNLSKRFLNEIAPQEALFCYSFQMMMENEHNLTYSMMLDNIVKDPVEKDYLFNAIHNIPTIKSMADWCFRWIDSPLTFAHRVVAFVVVEGLFFSGAFSSIYWLKEHKGNVLNGLVTSNHLIQRDENYHVEFGVALYNLLEHKLDAKTVNQIIREGLELCKSFTEEALNVRLLGMNREMMWQYQEYVADRLLVDLGYEKVYKKENPFSFMKNIGLQGKTNFFESRVTEYSSAYDSKNVKKELKKLHKF